MKTIFKKYGTIAIAIVIANLCLVNNSKAQISLSGGSTSTAVTTSTSTSTSLSINKPSGVSTGDLMILIIAKEGNTSDVASQSGWTLIDGANLGGTTTRNGSVLYRIADASESGPYAFSLGSGTSNVAATIVAFSGVDPTTPFDVVPGTIATFSSSTASATAISTATANAAVVMCGMVAGSARSWSNWRTGTPASLTLAEITEQLQGNTTDGASVGAAWVIKSSTGNTGAGAATLSSSERGGGILLALKPFSCPAIIATATKSDISCFNTNTGFITVNVPATGTSPFQYSIDNGAHYFNASGTLNYITGSPAPSFDAANRKFYNLPVGAYQIRVKDANGCESKQVQ